MSKQQEYIDSVDGAAHMSAVRIIAELEAALTAAKERTMAIRIIFDGPPGPDAGQFVEVETDTGESISIGEWIDRKDGYWALRIAKLPAPPEQEDTDENSSH